MGIFAGPNWRQIYGQSPWAPREPLITFEPSCQQKPSATVGNHSAELSAVHSGSGSAADDTTRPPRDLPGRPSAVVFSGSWGVGIGAPTFCRHSLSSAAKAAVNSGSFSARFCFSLMSFSRLYSSSRPSSKNSSNFQGPLRITPTGVVRQVFRPLPRYPGKCQNKDLSGQLA